MAEQPPGADFLDWLGPDTSAIVFTLLDHPADLARASAVSRSWRAFVIANQFAKTQCLRAWPDVSNFTSTQATIPGGTTGLGAVAEWDNQMREHRVYMHLSHRLHSPIKTRDCIRRCIGASSTDNFPEETIQNTLQGAAVDHVHMRPSYWSSGGQSDPGVPECLIYFLGASLCLVGEVSIRPFKAFFQYSDPIYSAQRVRFRMGYAKSPVRPEQLVSYVSEGQLTADDNYIWTYTSPEFPMLQENVLQSFKLPRPVLCIGGVVKVELIGRVQKQAMDELYYICVSRVQIFGNPLPSDLAMAPCKNGVVLKYTEPHRGSVCRSDSSGGDGDKPSKWHNFATRIWQSGTGRGIGWNQALLSRLLFGPPVEFVEGDDNLSEENGDEE